METPTSDTHELRLLAYIVKNQELFDIYGERLKLLHFTYKPAKEVFHLLFDIWTKHRVIPNKAEMEDLLKARATELNWALIQFQEISQFALDIWETEATNITGSTIFSYIATRERDEIVKALAESNSLSTDLPKLITRLKNVSDMVSRTGVSSLGISPFSENILANIDDYRSMLYGSGVVPTGFEKWDKMLDGGFRPGELILVLAATGVGKSMFMINIALNVVKAGKRVIYYALDNMQAEMLDRIWATATAIPVTDEKEKTEFHERILLSQGGDYHDRFFLKDYEPNSVKVSDICIHMQQMRNYWRDQDIKNGIPKEEAGKIDLVVVDYGDMVSSDQHYDTLRFELKRVFDDLTALAKRENVVVLTATQGNREALSKQVVTLKELSEAYSKAWPCSVVATLCQTQAERAQRALRMAIVKARRSENLYVNHFIVDYGSMRVIEHPDRKIEYMTEGDNYRKDGEATEVNPKKMNAARMEKIRQQKSDSAMSMAFSEGQVLGAENVIQPTIPFVSPNWRTPDA